MSNHVPRDREISGTAGTLNGDCLLALEEFLGLLAPCAQHGEDSGQGATAVEAEASGFQRFRFFPLFDSRDVGGAHFVQPLFIKIGLGGQEDKGFVRETKGPARALLGITIEFFDPEQGVHLIDLDGGESRFAIRDGGLRVEEIAIGFTHIFGEAASGDLLTGGGPRDENVRTGSAHVGGPGDRLGPGAGDEMESEHRHHLLEGFIQMARIAKVVLHEVQVVVGIDGRELASGHQDVAAPDEDGLDGGVLLWRLVCHGVL
jgi:hypothetical protein